jgi:outer membrane autotransporter protein
VRATRVDDASVQVDFSVSSTLTRTLAPVNGNNQTGPTGSPASNPLVVEARNNGAPTGGIGIAWSVVSGDATITAAGSPTNASGQAQASVTFGPTPGPIVIRAARNDDATVVADFTLTSTLTRALSIVSGGGQSAPSGSALPAPLVVEARNNGIAAPAIGITWAVVSGDATLAAATPTTDAAGRAQTGLQLGATAGAIVVRAARADNPAATADFTVTSTFNRTIALISGGNQIGIPGSALPNPIVLEVRGNGQPEAGVSVNIEVEGDASLSGDGESTAKLVRITDASGRVSAIVTLGPTSSGVVAIQASVPASPGVTTTIAATANNLANVPGLTEPQREVVTVLQQACGAITQLPVAQRTPEQNDLLARCQSFAGANPEQIADALEELLPDTTLAMVNVALQAGQAQLDNLKARIAALRSGTRGSSFGGLALASPAGAIPVTGLVGKGLGANETPEAGAEFDRWGYFVSGTIGRGESEQGRLTPNYDFDINGLTAGLDYRFSDGFVAGASLGYTRQDTELTGGEGNVDADGYSLSAYATFYRDESWYSDAVLTWGRNDYETQRRIRYTLTGPGGTSTIDQIARGQLDGDLLSIASTVGRDYQAGTWSIGPYGRVLYSRIDFDAGRELISGGAGSGLALEIFPGTHTSLASVVGAKFSTALSRDWGILMPHLQVEWEHEYRDDPQRVGARFLADPNATRFAIEGDPIDSSFFRIGGGLSMLFSGGRSGFLYVERVVGKSGFTQTNVALGIRGEF